MGTVPVLSKVHTFAQDLSAARQERGGVTSAAPSAPKTAPVGTPTTTKPATPPQKSTPIQLTASASKDASYPATIITDQKRLRTNVTSEVSSAIGDWWNKKITGIKKGNKPTYHVPAVDRRKGVIETATTMTGRAATVDHQAIVAKLKAETKNPSTPAPSVTKPVVATAPVVPAQPVDTEPVGWVTDEPKTASTGEIDLIETTPTAPLAAPTALTTPQPATSTVETPKTTPPTTNSSSTASEGATVIAEPTMVVTAVVPKTNILPTMPVFESAPETMEESVAEVEPFELPISTPVPAPTIEDPLVPRTFAKIEPVLPVVADIPVTPQATTERNAFRMLAEVPVPVVSPLPDHVKAAVAERKENLAPVDDSVLGTSTSRFWHIAPIIAGGLFVMVTIGGIAYIIMSNTTGENIPVISDTELPSAVSDEMPFPEMNTAPVAVAAQLDAPYRTSLYNAIAATAGMGDGLQLVTPMAHDTALPLSSRDILLLINRQFTPAFLGVVSEAKVGMYHEEPVLVLSVSNEEHARGGMFAWEDTMSQDLNPWFGTALRTSNGQKPRFSDETNNSHDVRVLKDDLGAPRITYGFVNGNTILITTTAESFLNVSSSYSAY